jgi:glutamyl-tRNA synthetase
MSAPRLRFAPSPSGYLHIGGARTALFCWLYARRTGGTFVLRVEDTDAERSTDASIQAILDSLRWLGLDWDEGPGKEGPHAPYFQSQRGHVYRRYIEQLVQTGHVYRCFCTTEELDRKRETALAEGRKPAYDGSCRDLRPEQWPLDKPYVLRLRSPLSGETVLDDLVRGRIVFQNQELSDQVVVRSNGDPLYNFVVVCDDIEMGITHVLRGDDHINNTPKQILLYQALSAALPKFAHVPLILGEDKKRLSKRHGATSVMQYEDEGYLSAALVNYLVRLGWSHGDQEIFSRQDLVEHFSIEAIGRSPGIWNPEKLLWVNGQWITRTPSLELAKWVSAHLSAHGFPAQPADELMARRIDTLKERARTLVEIVQQGGFYWADALAVTWDPAARKKFLNLETAPRLRAAAAALRAVESWEQGTLEAALGSVLTEFGIAIGKLAQPLRVSVTGGTVSPGIFETIAALGREKTLARLEHAVALAEQAAE